MSTIDTSLEKHLLSCFKDMADCKVNNNFEKDRDSFVFHMTDWVEDLKSLHRLYSMPSEVSAEESKEALQALLFHTLPHLLAAAEIYDDAPEIYSMLMKKGFKAR
jgi:hypothetical protein